MPHLYNEFFAYLEDEFEKKKKNRFGMRTPNPKNMVFMLIAHRSSTLFLFLFSLMVWNP